MTRFCPSCNEETEGYVATAADITGPFWIDSRSGDDVAMFMDERHPVTLGRPICDHCDGLLVEASSMRIAA